MREETPPTRASCAAPRWRRWTVVGVAVAVAAVVLATAGRRGTAWLAREVAANHVHACEFGAAQWWLGWSAILDPGDFHTDLLRAACHRQLGLPVAWQASLTEAIGKKAPPSAIAVERRLDQIRRGELDQGAEAEMGALLEAGASQTDVVGAFVSGRLLQNDVEAARLLLTRVSPHFRDKAQQEYLWGLCLLGQKDVGGARARLAGALEIQPSHELARAELGGLLEANNDLEGALGQFVELAARYGGSIPARTSLARVLRKMGRIEEARSVLAPLEADRAAGLEFQLEMTQIALESGDYEEAERRCRGVPPESVSGATLMAAALTLTLRQKPQEAQPLFLKAVALEELNNQWEVERRFRLTTDPADLAKAEEKARLPGPEAPALASSPKPTKEPSGLASTDKSAARAADLFRVHCSHCHGLRGDGYGVASHHMFPRPRDLRAGTCRIVSTVNGVPTLEDLEQVLARGMPGTSMPAFDQLPASDRRLLGQEVLRLRGEGVGEQIRAALGREGEEIDESDVRQAVQRATIPGAQVPLPSRWPDTGQDVLRGKTHFAVLGCVKCHGETGTGAADQDLFDDLGEPSRPRDLVHEPLKGGRDRASIYWRIVAGMPGTPHPATSNLSPQQVAELVDYVRSLAQEPPSMLTNHQRRVEATAPAYLDSLRRPPAFK